MARLTVVPDWVRPPVRAVASVEDYLLRLFGRTRSPEALGGHVALMWLGGVDRDATIGPLVWRAAPDHVELAWSLLAVADVLAEGEPYPSASWWRERRGIAPMSPLQWEKWTESWVERQYAHGVTCALGWVLREIDDPALMAPLHTGTGALIPFAEREEYRIRLRACALPDGARAGDLGSWPPVARAR